MVRAPAESALTALAISPNAGLLALLAKATTASRYFQVLSEEREYPSAQTLSMRLRQLQPDVVLLDVAAAETEAARVLGQLSQAAVIAVHTQAPAEAIVKWLRLGVADFLSAPFDEKAQHEAASRVKRIRVPEQARQAPGKLVAFSSAKPGSGSSSLAVQTAIALAEAGNQRVLLADLDLGSASASALFQRQGSGSVADVLSGDDSAWDRWPSLVLRTAGIEVLPAPTAGGDGMVEFHRFHELLEFARSRYDWALLDLPVVFRRLTLYAFTEADRSLLVTTPDLPSLHLARRATSLLQELGFDLNRLTVLQNRNDGRSPLPDAEVAKLLNCKHRYSLPNDFAVLSKASETSQLAHRESVFGKGIRQLAAHLVRELGEKP